MVYVLNDLHGAAKLIAKAIDAISGMKSGDILVINGDGAGARGPVMNGVVKIYYEVRRGETDVAQLKDAVAAIIGEEPAIPESWIYQAVHAGMFRKLMADKYPAFRKCMNDELKAVLTDTLKPISESAKAKDVQVIYSAGNGEIVPDDFKTDDITVEHAVQPEDRYYQKLAREGFFDKFGIEYVSYGKKLPGGIAIVSTNLLDLGESKMYVQMNKCGLLEGVFSTIIVHYPPTVAPIGKSFDFWNPNCSDVRRIEMLTRVLHVLPSTIDPFIRIFFGHIHLGANDPRMDTYPDMMGFTLRSGRQAYWVKPGAVIGIN